MQKNNSYLFLHISVFLFGFTAILGKLIEANQFCLVWNRMWLALPAFFFIPGFIKKMRQVTYQKMFAFLAVGVLVAAHWLTFYGSIKIGNSASLTLASLGLASWFTSIIEPLINKVKISKVDMSLGLIAVLGIGLIAFSQNEIDSTVSKSDFMLAIIWGVISAFLATLFTVFNAKFAKKNDALNITFFEMLGGFLFLSLLYIVFRNNQSLMQILELRNMNLMPTSGDWKWLLILGIVCTTGAFAINVTAMKEVSAFTANVAINLEPVYGIILAFFIFKEGENFNYLFYIGTAIILFTVFLQSFLSYKKKKNGHQPSH